MAYITYKTLLGFIFADYFRFYVYLVKDYKVKNNLFWLYCYLSFTVRLNNETISRI